jgi:hypothetical protein
MSLYLASWPGVAGILLLAVAFATNLRSSAVTVQRTAAALGLAAVLPLFLLGVIWPSAFTLAALFALPAGILLLAGIARPSLLHGSKARTYSALAVFLSPLCLLIETLWLPGGDPNVSEYEVISSSTLLVLEGGQTPPGECTELGTVDIPQRTPGFFARHLGLAEEEFHRVLAEQLKPLKANLLIPHEGSDLSLAGSSGQPFQGTAYSCP